ncbi:MAG: hypothetical protein GW893_22485 [Armatimonadetes bacterium]|nr:hypothetical protein [Armatimonadota bacterium]
MIHGRTCIIVGAGGKAGTNLDLLLQAKGNQVIAALGFAAPIFRMSLLHPTQLHH